MVRFFAVAAAIALSGLVAGDALSDLEKKGRPQLVTALAASKTCTADKLSVRREWGDMSAEARHAYIDAVLCLTRSPSKLDAKKYPGAKSRYDDFIAVHMNQTMRIHDTVREGDGYYAYPVPQSGPSLRNARKKAKIADTSRRETFCHGTGTTHGRTRMR
jgi:hypothetical protein